MMCTAVRSVCRHTGRCTKPRLLLSPHGNIYEAYIYSCTLYQRDRHKINGNPNILWLVRENHSLFLRKEFPNDGTEALDTDAENLFRHTILGVMQTKPITSTRAQKEECSGDRL